MSEDKYAPLFKGTDFGGRTPTELIRKGLSQVAMGYWNGYTLQQIMLEQGWVRYTPRDGHDYQSLTESGLKELVSLMTEQS